MIHDRAILASFMDGETRLVAAAWRDDSRPDLFFLADDTAQEYRSLTKSDLRCLIEECPSPELTTVHRSRGRDHFRHVTRGAGGHAAESEFHVQGKAVIADQLRRKYPHAKVEVERGIDTQRSRIADILVTSPNGKHRVAIEIQYAALSVSDWRERHESYASQGIVDVWMWGHFGSQLKVRPGSHRWGSILLNLTQQAVVDRELPMLWINPILRKVGTVSASRSAMPNYHSAYNAADDFNSEDLDSLALDIELGLTNHRARELVQAVREKRLAEEARAKTERELAETLAAEERFWIDLTVMRTKRWDQSIERFMAVDQLEEFRAWLGVETGSVLGYPAEQWQLLLYRAHIEGKPNRTRISIADLIATLRFELGGNCSVNLDAAALSVPKWLELQVAAGTIVRRASAEGWLYLTVGPMTEAQRKNAIARAAYNRTKPGLPTNSLNAPSASRYRPSTMPANSKRCDVCGGPLDPVFVSLGRHGVCAQGRR